MTLVSLPESEEMGSDLSDLAQLDWDYRDDDTRYLTHSFHPYSAKYIPQIPQRLIGRLSKPGDLVLDPFLGSGTTLVEARILGRVGLGIDINPLAVLVSRAKTTTIEPELLESTVGSHLRKVKREAQRIRGQRVLDGVRESTPATVSPDQLYGAQIERWFQPQVISELRSIIGEIYQEPDIRIRDFLLVGFSSLLRTVSNAASGFGNLMISHHPPRKENVLQRYETRILEMTRELNRFWELAHEMPAPCIQVGDARSLGSSFGQASVDLICTHPPYMAAVPYAEYQRLSLWWLGFNPRALDAELIGGQRSRSDTPARFDADMRECFAGMYAVLKPQGFCCIVIGNPVYRGEVRRLNSKLAKMAENVGFVEQAEVARNKTRMTVGRMREEYVQVFLKP